jgi:hypothetical protein
MWMAVGAFFAFTAHAQAAFTFLGPTPYLSTADSPFPVGGSNPSFFLEDFEDGQITAPGIHDSMPSVARGIVLGPGGFTDSVDADDGELDGVGQQGHSYASGFTTVQLTAPPARKRYFQFDLDPIFNGKLPNAFGFVWTDGAASSHVLLEFYGASGELVFSKLQSGLGDDSRAGTVVEDQFLGVLGDEGIGRVAITSIFLGDDVTFEIDHVQFGRIVPEAKSLWLASICAGVLRICRPRPLTPRRVHCRARSRRDR